VSHRQGIGEGLLNFFFPQHCVGCGGYIAESAGYPLCAECELKIQTFVSPYCLTCGRPVGSFRQTKCRRCREKPFSFDIARAITIYDSPMKEAIQAFKYRKIISFRLFFINLLIEFMNGNPFFREVDAILPVPLHPTRLREREFNQSEIIARGISDWYHVPLISKAVDRVKKTQSQVGLSMKERRLNLLGAFEVKNAALVRHQRILIIDDVITSRSTVESLSATLRRSECKTILVLALATGK